MNRIAAVVAGLSLAFVGTSASFADTINVPGDQPNIAAAISASVNGDVINIAAGTYNEHSLNTGGKAITIQGTLNADGSLATTIDAQQDGGVFVIISGEGSGTEIKDLVLTGGWGYAGDGFTKGGAIFIQDSSPTIIGCTITDNQSFAGGGIFCLSAASLSIIDCVISDNGALSGGGIYCGAGCNLAVTDCTITGNVSGQDGGGILVFQSNLSLTGCVISENTDNGGSGGGLYVKEPVNVTLNYSVFCGNNGGQVDCESGTNCYTNNGSGISDECGTASVIVALARQIQNLSSNINQQQSIIDAQQSAIDDLEQVIAACCAAQSCAGDENNDGVVNIEDLLIIIDAWGPCI